MASEKNDIIQLLTEILKREHYISSIWDNKLSDEDIATVLAKLQEVIEDPDADLIEQGNALLQKVLAHQRGIGGLKNTTEEKIALYDKAIDKGNADAMNNRALMYQNGLGEDGNIPNYQQAIALYQQAIDKGNANAMNNRAVMYEEGLGEDWNKPNYQQAIALYQQAIDKGNADAMNNRAYMYKYGLGEDGNTPNYEQAIALYQQAIDKGHVTAMFNRAVMYENGLGEKNNNPNYPKAFELYKLSNFYNSGVYDNLKQNSEIKSLYNKIQSIETHGTKIRDNKGKIAKQLARDLQGCIDVFLLLHSTEAPHDYQVDSFKREFMKTLHSQDKTMQQHRAAWQPIVANIALALTGIGLLAIIVNAVNEAMNATKEKPLTANKAFFFAQTKSEQLAADIEQQAGESINSDIFKAP